jgi:HK97 family phage portal protein
VAIIGSNGALVLSEATPMWGNASWYSHTGYEMTHRFATYAAIYRNHQMVATVVDRIAECIARLPFKVYQRADDGRLDARDTPFAQLLRKPNARHDPYYFWQWTVSTYLVHGEAMWLKLRGDDGRPIELWPLNPVNISVDRDDAGQVWYTYLPGGSVPNGDAPRWPIEDVVHFKMYDPEGTMRGLSPLEPLRATVTNSDAARRAGTAMWQNGMRPSLVLKHPQTISNNALTRLQADWASKHQGVDNWSKPAILEEGMEVEKLTLSADEAQYIQTMKYDDEKVCQRYNLSPIAVHILDHATYANVTTSLRAIYRDSVAPRCGALESTVDHQLRPDFDRTGDYYAEFLLDEVLRGDFEERIAAQAAGVNAGLLMPAEGRQMENRPFVEGSDVLIVNGNMIPLDAVVNPPEPPQQLALPMAGEGDAETLARMERDLARTNVARR